MPRFRPNATLTAGRPPGAPTSDEARSLAAAAIAPGHFFVPPPFALECEHVAEETVPWEVYKGRLLGAAQTRQRRTFEAWNVYLVDEEGRAPEPLLSLKLDAAAGELHVTRSVLCYVWEAYDAGGNVIQSREARRWAPELVGTLALARFAGPDDLLDEIICQLHLAVVGASRLPLTSVESPLPAFTLGRLAYCYRDDAGPVGPARACAELVERAPLARLAAGEKVKLLECVLRAATPESAAERAAALARRHELGGGAGLLGLLRDVFNDVSLSPYTGFVDNTLSLLRALEAGASVTAADLADYLGDLLLRLARHLTAYDLVTFHHRGANYPDALLLDASLKEYLALAEDRAELFAPADGDAEREAGRKRRRRRALRQGCLLRRRYEGHPVPDAPTSPGENARVLPSPHVRVPEEQILQPHRRTKRLYEGDPLDRHLGARVRALLRDAGDLGRPRELLELGTALFLDRPLGGARAPGEPDQTPLLAYECFSRSVAADRLAALAAESGRDSDLEGCRRALAGMEVPGVPASECAGVARPGAVSLADAARVADDFLVLRTTPRSAADLIALFDWRPLSGSLDPSYLTAKRVLLVRARGGEGEVLRGYDSRLRRRLELCPDGRRGFARRGGVEYPAAGLLVLRAWDGEGEEHDFRARPLRLASADESPSLAGQGNSAAGETFARP